MGAFTIYVVFSPVRVFTDVYFSSSGEQKNPTKNSVFIHLFTTSDIMSPLTTQSTEGRTGSGWSSESEDAKDPVRNHSVRNFTSGVEALLLHTDAGS